MIIPKKEFDSSTLSKKITVRDIVRLCGTGEVIEVYYSDQRSLKCQLIPVLTIAIEDNEDDSDIPTDETKMSYFPDKNIHILDAEVQDGSFKTKSQIIYDSYSVSRIVLYVDR